MIGDPNFHAINFMQDDERNAFLDLAEKLDYDWQVGSLGIYGHEKPFRQNFRPTLIFYVYDISSFRIKVQYSGGTIGKLYREDAIRLPLLPDLVPLLTEDQELKNTYYTTPPVEDYEWFIEQNGKRYYQHKSILMTLLQAVTAGA